MWPLLTSEDEDCFINEYARKKKSEISESQSHGVTEFFSEI